MTTGHPIIDQLALEQIEHNLFRGYSENLGTPRVFGGQVIGQALTAALRTVNDRHCHSLHGYFLRPGDPSLPIIYEVDRIRDGRSFTTRRVIAIQSGQAIFNMSCSFQVLETGLRHQMEAPDVPKPDALPDIGVSDKAHRIRRVRQLGDIKVALEEIWIDGEFNLDDGQSHMSHSLYQLYKEHLGCWVAKVEDSVSVAPMPAWGQSIFDQSDQSVWGFCERLAWDQHGRLIEVSSTWFDPAKARYRARWK